MQRQPFGSRRSVHQRIPRQARHHAPGHGGVASAQLGIRASSGGRSLICPSLYAQAAGGHTRPSATVGSGKQASTQPPCSTT
jgi:hypothetical protein